MIRFDDSFNIITDEEIFEEVSGEFEILYDYKTELNRFWNDCDYDFCDLVEFLIEKDNRSSILLPQLHLFCSLKELKEN